MRSGRAWLLIALAAVLVALPGGVQAQDGIAGWVDVFVDHNAQTGQVHLYFVDALSGLNTVTEVDNGQNFTVVGGYVLYQKPLSGAIMRANVDGTLEPHPFIRHSSERPLIRWVTSSDAQAIAWVQSDAAGSSEAYVAWADGRELRQLPLSAAAGQALAPLALTNGMMRFFYDTAHPALPSLTSPYTLYTQISAYNTAAETLTDLPQEPNCPCGAAVTPDGRIYARLEAVDGQGPFALRVWDLPSGSEILIPASALPYRLAGDLLLNSVGTLAVYSVATGSGGPAAPQGEQYGLVLVDIVAQQQYLVLSPGPARYRPAAFIDEDSALLLTGAPDGPGGTYKLNLSTGALQKVSEQIYLGTIRLAP